MKSLNLYGMYLLAGSLVLVFSSARADILDIRLAQLSGSLEELTKSVPKPVEKKLSVTDKSKAALLSVDPGERVTFANAYVNPLQTEADPATDTTLDIVKKVAGTLGYAQDDKGAKEFAGDLVAVFDKMVTADKVLLTGDPGANWNAYVVEVKKLALAIK